MGALQRLAGHALAPTRTSTPTSARCCSTPTGRARRRTRSSGCATRCEGVRDQLSGDTWRAFGTTDRATQALRASPHSHQIAESAGRMLTGILSLQGVTASMMRDDGWHVIERRPLPRAGAPGVPPAGRRPPPSAAASTSTARCSTGC